MEKEKQVDKGCGMLLKPSCAKNMPRPFISSLVIQRESMNSCKIFLNLVRCFNLTINVHLHIQLVHYNGTDYLQIGSFTELFLDMSLIQNGFISLVPAL